MNAPGGTSPSRVSLIEVLRPHLAEAAGKARLAGSPVKRVRDLVVVRHDPGLTWNPEDPLPGYGAVAACERRSLAALLEDTAPDVTLLVAVNSHERIGRRSLLLSDLALDVVAAPRGGFEVRAVKSKFSPPGGTLSLGVPDPPPLPSRSSSLRSVFSR